MSGTILEDFSERMLAGLTRASITTASKWAEKYRRTKQGTPWSVAGWAPWSKEWHDSMCEHACILKAAQLTATESMISKGQFANDVLKQDVLYVLPNWRPDASDFSASRFDVAVKSSPYLENLYDRSNVGHKRTSVANFYIRGGQGRAGLKSVPVSWLFLDEVDEMDQANIPLAYERTSGQLSKHIWELSTPTMEDHGISKSYSESSQEHFCFRCPLCNKLTELSCENKLEPECLQVVGDDPTSIKVLEESYLKCRECHGRLDHGSKRQWLREGLWISNRDGMSKRGFYINQLYSTTVTPGQVAASFLKGQLNQADEQEFWNSKMGLPHTPAGARVTEPQVNACKGAYKNGATAKTTIVTMGVDVGKRNHYEICEWHLAASDSSDVNEGAFCRVLKAGNTVDLDELDALMNAYLVNYCVIDAHPDRRGAYRFACRFWGIVSMCIYGNGISGKQLHVHKGDDGDPLVTVDRTSWLDQSLGRFKNGRIQLPMDVPFEYIGHVAAPARIWRRDGNGNPVGVWVTPSGKGDHHAHARNYAEIAFALCSNLKLNYDIPHPMFGGSDSDEEFLP